MILLGMLLSPDMQYFLAGQFAAAAVTPVGFEMLDRVPVKQPADPPAEEDAMAVQKTAA